MNTLSETVDQLVLEVRALKAEAEARRLLGRYMFLCDTPLPEYGMSEQERARAIGELFTEDAIWEGVGGTHRAQFGRQVGPDQIAAHMLRFHLEPEPERVFNTHYVCTEQVRATPDGAEGNWVQFQPGSTPTAARSSAPAGCTCGSGRPRPAGRSRTTAPRVCSSAGCRTRGPGRRSRTRC